MNETNKSLQTDDGLTHESELQETTLSRWVRWAFGYDFFISYAHSDGARYATALAQKLEGYGFEVFLDRAAFAVGQNWQSIGDWTLKQTSKLILVGTADALESKPVLREVSKFSATGKSIIPIDVDGSLAERSEEAQVFAYLDGAVLRIERAEASAEDGGPSEIAINRVRHGFNIVRQHQRRIAFFAGVSLLLVVLAGTAVAFGLLANEAAQQADTERQIAEQRAASILTDTGRRLLQNGDEQRAMAYLNGATRLDPLNDDAANLMYRLVSSGLEFRLLMKREPHNMKTLIGPDYFHFEPDEALSDYESDPPTKTMMLKSEKSGWEVRVTYDYGNFQAHQLPLFFIDHHALPETAEIQGLFFDEAEQTLGALLWSGEVAVVRRDGSFRLISEDDHWVEDARFLMNGKVLVTIADRDVRLWPLVDNLEMPPPLRFSGARDVVEIVQKGDAWCVTVLDSQDLTIWSERLEASLGWQTVVRENDPPKRSVPITWTDRTRFTVDGNELVADREFEGWALRNPKTGAIEWDGLVHPLSPEDGSLRYRQDESFDAPTAPIRTNAAVSRDGNVVITSAGSSEPRLWRRGQKAPFAELPIPDGRYVAHVKLDVTGEKAFVLLSSDDRDPNDSYLLFDAKNGVLLGQFDLPHRAADLVDISHDLSSMLVQIDPSTFEVRQLGDGRAVGVPLRLDGDGHTAVLNLDGTLIATGTKDGVFQLWRTADGVPVSEPMPVTYREGATYAPPWFSDDGNFLRTAVYGQSPVYLERRIGLGLTLEEAHSFSQFIEGLTGWRLGDGDLLESSPRLQRMTLAELAAEHENDGFRELADNLLQLSDCMN